MSTGGSLSLSRRARAARAASLTWHAGSSGDADGGKVSVSSGSSKQASGSLAVSSADGFRTGETQLATGDGLGRYERVHRTDHWRCRRIWRRESLRGIGCDSRRLLGSVSRRGDRREGRQPARGRRRGRGWRHFGHRGEARAARWVAARWMCAVEAPRLGGSVTVGSTDGTESGSVTVSSGGSGTGASGALTLRTGDSALESGAVEMSAGAS